MKREKPKYSEKVAKSVKLSRDDYFRLKETNPLAPFSTLIREAVKVYIEANKQKAL